MLVLYSLHILDTSMDDLHQALKTWLTVEDEKSVKREGVELERLEFEVDVDKLG